MNRWLLLAKVVVFFLVYSVTATAWASNSYILEVAGAVSIAADKSIEPRPANKSDPVASGTVIRTGDNGYAVVKFADGQVVSMQANTTFQVREYIYNPGQIGESSLVLSMFRGGMHFVAGQIARRNNQAFRLATPDATITNRGTEFMVVMDSNATFSKVLSGNIDMTNAAGFSSVSAGQTALTFSSGTLTTIVPAASVPAATFSEVAAIRVDGATSAGTTVSSGDASANTR